MSWQNLLKELSAAGLTQAHIAKSCGCSQSSISDLATGRTTHPSYQIGVALMELQRKAKRKKPTKAEA